MTGFRAPAVNLFLLVVLLTLLSATVAVALSVLFAPPLSIAERTPAVFPSTVTKTIRRPDEPSIRPVHNRAAAESARSALRLAVFHETDAGALASLNRNAVRLDGLIPDWLELRSVRGDDMLKNIARQGEAFDWLKRQARHVKLYPLLQTRMPERETAMLIAVPALRAELIGRIAGIVREHGFEGVTIGLSSDAIGHHIMAVFIHELRRALLPEGRKVIYLAETDAEPARLSQIASQADFVVVQTQERISAGISAGPVASQGWFEQELRTYSASVPPAKLIVAIGSFATDWGPRGQKTELSIQQAWEIASRSNASITLDPVALNSVFSYRDPKGEMHEVWIGLPPEKWSSLK